MRFHVVVVGRVRDPGLRAACDEYVARARRYIKLDIHEVRGGGRQGKDPESILCDEGTALLRAVPSTTRLMALARDGRAYDSRAFADRLDRWRQEARDVAFVIGGAYGLHESVRRRSEESLRLSDMTLPHEVARLVLLEQIYRGYSILKGEPYHKGE